MNNVKQASVAVVIVSAIVLGGCSNLNNTQKDTLGGAAIGAAGGAVIGSMSGNAGTGAAIGAAVGAVGGSMMSSDH